jgi:hypothetical protein
VGGSRGPPNSFGAPTQVCGSPLERYPLVGRNGRRFCAFIRLGAEGVLHADLFLRCTQGVTRASSRALSSFGVSLATVQTFTLDSAFNRRDYVFPLLIRLWVLWRARHVLSTFYRVLYQSDTAKGAVGPDQIFAFGKLGCMQKVRKRLFFL